MTRWVNHSGTAVNVPLVGHDVDDGEEIDVPDDVILPSGYFQVVGAPANIHVVADVPADSGTASDAGFGVNTEEE